MPFVLGNEQVSMSFNKQLNLDQLIATWMNVERFYVNVDFSVLRLFSAETRFVYLSRTRQLCQCRRDNDLRTHHDLAFTKASAVGHNVSCLS